METGEKGKSADLGDEWLVDAHACDPASLRDVRRVRDLLDHVVAVLGLSPVGDARVHQFGGEAGITALVLLSESHLAIHTFPEHRAATLNLYCCRPRPAFGWEAPLRTFLGAARVVVRHVPRGGDG